MKKKLYLECASGISGDMFTGALIDLGADQDVLRKALGSLKLEGVSVEINRTLKSGLDVCDFLVRLDPEYENHDHDMEYLHGDSHVHQDHHHEGEHAEHSEHHHENGHTEHSEHQHEHRNLEDILKIIRSASITENAAQTAEKIFRILGEAEAKAHGVSLENVHFHEVGALDSILDILAAAVCLDNLAVDEVIIPVIREGCGTIRCQHGILPIPVPAVCNIAEMYGLNFQIMKEEGEFVTPTGAAIAAAVRTSEKLPDQFKIIKTGIGAGKREYHVPSMLRAFLIEDITDTETDRICKMECNLDDCTGEALGYVMEKLMTEGARDVHFTPVYMKKNRPAVQLNVICDPALSNVMESIIFEETTTIGIRKIMMDRTILKRSQVKVQTKSGEAVLKKCTLPSGEVRYYPEYESARKLALETGNSYEDILNMIKQAAYALKP